MRLRENPTNKLLDKGILTKIGPNSNSFLEYSNICTGFGVDIDIPVRAAAYSLPVLQMGEMQHSAQTEFYIAESFATKLNGLNPAVTRRNTQLIQEYIKLLRLELGVNHEVWLTEKDPFETQRTGYIKEMAKILRKNGSEKLLRFADTRNGDESLAYIAAHALYMWDPHPIDSSLFITERPNTPESLLIIGGPAEKLFYEARQLLLSHIKADTSRKTEQGFTEIGRRPTYYAVDDETILNGKKIRIDYEEIMSIPNPDVLRDTLYLVISLSDTLLFEDINRLKKGTINPYELDDLAAGCNKLNKIIAQLQS